MSRTSCLRCDRYLVCKDPSKSIIYLCDRYKETKQSQHDEKVRLEDLMDAPFVTSADEYLPIVDPHEDGTFNAFETIKSMIKDRRMVSPDIKIPEGDFPEAPNFYTWCISDQYLDQKPFVTQALIGTKLFGEFCPKCSDVEWMEHGVRAASSLSKFESKVALLEYGKCPHCQGTRIQFYQQKLLHPYWELALSAGQRSGKSAMFGMMSAYLTHRMIKMEKPNEVFGLLKANVLQGTFVALTFAQAKDTLWEPFYGHLLESPWYKNYHNMLSGIEDHHGGEGTIFRLKDTFVYYRHRRIQVYPAAPDKRVLRGRCLTGSTLVNTNQGFLHFNELITDLGQHSVKGLSIDSPTGAKRVSHTYRDTAETLSITTLNGFCLAGTYEHPMLVLRPDLTYRWIRLDELRVGDWIVSTTKQNSTMFGTAGVDKNLSTIAGYMVANGYRNTVSSNDPAVVARLYRCVKRLTGLTPYSTRSDILLRADTHYLPGNGKGQIGTFVSEFLEPLGYRDARSNRKEIPIALRSAPKEVLHEFLESYFECDSGINGGGSTRNTAPSEIEVGSASRRLALQVHTILFQAYGILGRVKPSVRYDKLDRSTGLYTARREHWIVSISGGDAYRFIQAFKRAKVQKYADRFDNVDAGRGSDRRNVPYVRKYVRDIYEAARVQSKEGKRLRTLICENGDKVTKRYPRPTFGVNARSTQHGTILNAPLPEFVTYGEDWETIVPLLERLDARSTKRLKAFLSKAGHYEEVVSIKRGKRRAVYDVTVPDGHAFTANCLVSHNTRFVAGVDELGWFDNSLESAKNIKMNANEVYIALERSLLTVRSKATSLVKQGFYNVPFGYFINISSPSSSRDKIMELVRKSQGSRRMLGLIKPTWEMNPHVPRSALNEEFRKDPEAAMRDYGAQPPLTNSPFLAAVERIEACMSEKVHKLDLTFKTVRSRDKASSEIYAELAYVRESGKPSVLALDAGVSNNSFSFAIGHRAKNGYPVISVVGEIIPLPGIRINHSLVYSKVLTDLIALRNVVLISADRWNSLKVLADAEQEFGINKRQYSLKYADMQLFKSYIDDKQLLLPRPAEDTKSILHYDHSKYPHCFKNKPAEHLLLQMLTVQDTGTQVIKGEQLTDDVLRAVMLCFRMLIDEEHDEILNAPEEAINTRVDITTMAFARNYSTGAGSSGMNGGSGSSMGVLKPRQ